ncbi:MAG: hypothetical protein ACI4TU_00070 [Candidatus Cryptobacteroides sp.]
MERYIAKGQKVITSVKVSGSDVLSKIKEIDMSHGFPQGMTIAPKDNLYYAQYDMDYSVGGSQVDICKAFGFTIPDGCAPVYVSKAKPVTRRLGRPANPKVENQEL